MNKRKEEKPHIICVTDENKYFNLSGGGAYLSNSFPYDEKCEPDQCNPDDCSPDICEPTSEPGPGC